MESIVSRFDETVGCLVKKEWEPTYTPEECIVNGFTYEFAISYKGKDFKVPLMIGSRNDKYGDSSGLKGYFIIDGECKTVTTQDKLDRNLVKKGVGYMADGRRLCLDNGGKFYIADKYGKNKSKWLLPYDINHVTKWSKFPNLLEEYSKNFSRELSDFLIPSVEICIIACLLLEIDAKINDPPPPIHTYLSAGPLMRAYIERGALLHSSFKTGTWKVSYIEKEVTGVSETMHHYTYVGDLSAILRVSPPVDKDNMPAKDRLIDPTTYGKFCLIETIEGGMAGTIGYLTKDAELTSESSIEYSYKHNGVPLILNGRFKDMVCRESVKTTGDFYERDGILYVMTMPNRIKSSLRNGLLSSYLGHTASLLYLIEHNPAVRAVFACNMIKQAITSDQRVIDGMFNETWYLVEGEQPHAGPHFKYPSGRNVLVGLIPWKGFNIEDAIVISRSCSLKFTNKKFIVYKVGIQNCKTIKLIDDERYDEDGIIIEGSYIKKGDILATRYCSTEVNVLDNIKSSMEGIIDKIVRGIHCIRIRVVSENPLKIGDKMTSRHGQKGVVSLILPNEEMPYIKTTDEKIPLDILMNPMSIPSRETMGQILEMGNKFIDVEIPLSVYKECGISDHAIGFKKNKFIVGKVFYMALRHQSIGKSHCRNGGELDELTQQPLKGKARNGGVRFGQMEKDAMLAAGAIKTLENLYSVDICDTKICKECGAFMIPCTNPGHKMQTVKMHRSTQIFATYLRALGSDLLFNGKEYSVRTKIDWSMYKESHIVTVLRVSDLGFGVSNLDVLGKFICNKDIIPIIPYLARDFEVSRIYTDMIKTKKPPKPGAMKYLITSKEGVIRRKVEGKRMDKCIRAVIVPDPTLKIDTVKIPYNSYISEWALLNRQPTLTQYSLALVKMIKGDSQCIHINPLLCKRFGADFDGDEMNLYGLTEQKCISECRKVLPATGTPLQDYILSEYLGCSLEELMFNLPCDLRSLLEVMVKSKSRGKESNIKHIFESVGEMLVHGESIGYINSSYLKGLKTEEYVMQARAAREGIVAIGTATPITGDLNRKNNRLEEGKNVEDKADLGIRRVQEKYSILTQQALDAFHHAGAAYESIKNINELEKNVNVSELNNLQKMFVSHVREYGDNKWHNAYSSPSERLLFDLIPF